MMVAALMVGFGLAAVFFAWLAYHEQNLHMQTMDELGKATAERDAARQVLAVVTKPRTLAQVTLLDRLARERQERFEAAS